MNSTSGKKRSGEESHQSAYPLLISEHALGPIHYRIAALCFAAWIFDFFDLILYTFLLVPIARELHLNDTESSLVLGVSFAMAAAGGVMFGFISDRYGRKPTIIASVLLYGIGTSLCATVHSLATLLAYRALTGIGIGGEWGAGQSLIAETMPPQYRARYAAYVQVGAPLGVLLAAYLGGFLEPRIGWRASFIVSALPAFAVGYAVWRWLPESDVWQRRVNSSSPGFSEITTLNIPLRQGSESETSNAGKGRAKWRLDANILYQYRRLVAILFIVLLVNSEAYWFTYSWMPAYLQLVRKLSARSAGLLMARMQYGAIFGYAIFGRLADRFGRRQVFCAFALMMAVGLLPPTLLWNWASGKDGLIPGAMIIAGLGTGVWSGAGPMISEMLPTQVRNTALGLLLNVTRGIQFATPLLITFLSRRIGFGAALAIGALFSAIGAGMVWLLPETRGRIITALDAVREVPS
ncbi:MAG: MFS transporter [Deltaproteobacteria bacterium]|nr:MFS transporter [Deltaproteobacteria bacterium]